MTMPDQSPADVVLDDGPALNEFSQYAVSFEAWQAAQALARQAKLLEDATPVDGAWLHGVGFELESGRLVNGRLQFTNFHGWRDSVTVGRIGELTREQVRRLCWGLGIELREENGT